MEELQKIERELNDKGHAQTLAQAQHEQHMQVKFCLENVSLSMASLSNLLERLRIVTSSIDSKCSLVT